MKPIHFLFIALAVVLIYIFMSGGCGCGESEHFNSSTNYCGAQPPYGGYFDVQRDYIMYPDLIDHNGLEPETNTVYAHPPASFVPIDLPLPTRIFGANDIPK